MAIPSGVVYLCKNALVDRNYGHTIDFKNPEEQFAYWGSLVKYSISNFNYVRRQYQQIKVEKTLDELQDVNYLYYRAKENSKLYFCFITSKEYLSDTTTTITFETDVLQTYMFDYKVQPSYVLQEHCDRWDANHKPIYSRTEENLDYGSEYTVEKAYKIKSDLDIKWYLAICSEHKVTFTDGDESSTTATDIKGCANPYVMYLIPEHEDHALYSLTSYAPGLGETTHAISNLTEFVELMSDSAIGEYVQQIVRLPYLPFDFTYSVGDGVVNINATPTHKEDYVVGWSQLGDDKYFIKLAEVYSTYNFQRKLAEMGIFNGIESALPTDEQWQKVITEPYTTERDKRFESKLLTHPYRYNLLTDWKGSPILIKNEYIGGDKIKVNYTQSLSYNSPCRFWLENYKKDPEGRGSSLMQLVPDEHPVLNDAYYSYMLANKNQIKANETNARVSGAANNVNSVLGGFLGGGVYGALGGAVTGAISGVTSVNNLIRSENAKQKDLKNLPDSIINSNDGAFNVQDNNNYISFYRYKICCEFEELLADTFNISGYTVKRVKLPNLRTRVRFNYVKTVGANIVGSFDQQDLITIKQIFDNGITFWHYNNVNFKPFDYSLENIETKLLKG